MKIAPSLLSADFSILSQQILEIEKGGASYIHLDIMDGHFVPNITFGPFIVSAIKKCTKLPLDVHLMIENPDAFIEPFYKAGADIITVHQEACIHLYRTIQQIKKLGAKAGVSINPATPISTLKEIIGELDLVLIMTVEPGFGGQKLIPSMINKIAEMKDMIIKTQKDILLEVDGGIDKTTIKDVVKAGAEVLVAGTSVFNTDSISNAIIELKKLA